jgi:tRNA A-37 threonylcarbamoyl transferase component Bud32
MTPERWRQVQAVFHSALERGVAERSTFLDQACGEDRELREEVNSLLASDQEAGGFLEKQPLELPDLPKLAERLQASLGGRYRIERELVGGGMSRIFIAEEIALDRRVVIKVLPPDLSGEVSVQRFRREALLAAGLSHPLIVPVLTSGEADGLLYYTMPYVEGESLKERLAREGGLPIRAAVRILAEVTQALAYAHRRGIVHRDIKPANVLLDAGHARVVDFGIAKALDLAAEGGFGTNLTSTGVGIGTPAYIAPEQAVGSRLVDYRADLYALGVFGYELLTGAPPFQGQSPEELVAAHLADVPDTVAKHRPEVPPALTQLISQLLEKQPSDRPQSADLVLERLEAILPSIADSAAPPRGYLARLKTLSPPVLALGVIAGIVIVALHSGGGFRDHPVGLESHRVMVFPLSVNGSGLAGSFGEDIAVLLGYALENTRPLRWLEAADYMNEDQRRGARGLSVEERRAISRAQRAAYFIDGSVLRQGDSATVILRLHSVEGDSLLARSGASGVFPGTPPTELGLRAIGDLLVLLIEPGRRIDVSPLSDRKPTAIAAFLLGEREYRGSRFSRALQQYRVAIEEDSLFALASLKAALAASWLELPEEAERLARLGLRHVTLLSPHDAAFIRGLTAYLGGAADSAVAEFQRVLAFSEDRAEVWMALGEVHRHLLPNAMNFDSVAEAAFVRARAIDPGFTPPLYHLAELAIRRGASARADTLLHEYRRVNPDPDLARVLDLMLRCVRGGPTAVDWSERARLNPANVLEAGALLATGAAQPGCARPALRAVLEARGAPGDLRWGALFALQSLLVAVGKDGEVAQLLGSTSATGLAGEQMLFLDASAGASLNAEAATAAKELGEAYPTMGPLRLWTLGSWEAQRKRSGEVRAIARALAAKADSSRSRRDSLLARGMAARAVLLSGDTAVAIQRLQALTPSAPRSKLFWNPEEALAGESLLLAQLLMARGEYKEAELAASRLDGSPIVCLIYLRESLLLRARAAEAQGDLRRGDLYQKRYARLTAQ